MALPVKDIKAGNFPPAFKHRQVGDEIDGVIVDIRGPKSGEKDLNGDPVSNYVFQLRTDSGETFSLWAPENKDILRSIKAAAEEVNAATIEEGGRLRVALVGVDEPLKPGHNGMKRHKSVYTVPRANVSVDDI